MRKDFELIGDFLNVETISEEELISNYIAFYPAGSGSLQVPFRTVCSLLEVVGAKRGFDVSRWPKIAYDEIYGETLNPRYQKKD